MTIPQSHPYQLILSATDGTGDLYWTCEGCSDFGVWKAANNLSSWGGFAPVAVPGLQETTMGITLTPYEIYWAEHVTGEVRRIAKGGGTPYALSTGLPAGTLDLATDGTDIYLTGNNGHISRISVNVAGAPTDDLASGSWMPRSISLDSDKMYWCDAKTKKIMRAGKNGSGVCGIADAVFSPRSLVVESSWVYWREGTDLEGEGRVMKARDGCPSPEVVELATGQGGPRYLALHDDYVYYTMWSGSVRRLPKAGGPWEELYKSSEDAHGIAVDDRAVYWTSWGAGKVYRLAH